MNSVSKAAYKCVTVVTPESGTQRTLHSHCQSVKCLDFPFKLVYLNKYYLILLYSNPVVSLHPPKRRKYRYFNGIRYYNLQ